MNISILNYNACNIASVYHAFYNLGADVKIINKEEFKFTDKLVIPGVGAAKSAIDYLHKSGLFYSVSEFLKSGKPILGICLRVSDFSENLFENGFSNGFGHLKGSVVEFKECKDKAKFHIGWNNININQDLKEFFQYSKSIKFLFCHSFFLKLNETKKMLLTGQAIFKKILPPLY